jgi:glycosyltransferase involved in cell wall biosynthesis
MTLPIVFPTYYRPDGKSGFYVRRLLDSIYNQTHQDFVVYMIGDKYYDGYEFTNIADSYDDRLKAINLSYAKERDKYKDSFLLWNYGGVNAMNTGIEAAMGDGFTHICLQNHDDFYYPQYLESVNDCILETVADFVFCKAIYLNGNTFPSPPVPMGWKYFEHYPKFGELNTATVCMNFSKIPFLFRDVYELTMDGSMPADGDLWERVRPYMLENGLKSVFINDVLVNHEEEKYLINNFEQIKNHE